VIETIKELFWQAQHSRRGGNKKQGDIDAPCHRSLREAGGRHPSSLAIQLSYPPISGRLLDDDGISLLEGQLAIGLSIVVGQCPQGDSWQVACCSSTDDRSEGSLLTSLLNDIGSEGGPLQAACCSSTDASSEGSLLAARTSLVSDIGSEGGSCQVACCASTESLLVNTLALEPGILGDSLQLSNTKVKLFDKLFLSCDTLALLINSLLQPIPFLICYIIRLRSLDA